MGGKVVTLILHRFGRGLSYVFAPGWQMRSNPLVRGNHVTVYSHPAIGP